jgi:hypothetical protein
MKPTKDQLSEWTEHYFSPGADLLTIRETIVPNLVQDVVEWVTEEIAQEFDRKERGGAKGYGPSVPAKIVRELGTSAGPTLKEMSLRALDNLVLPSQKFSDSYKLLKTVLSNIPESPTNTR